MRRLGLQVVGRTLEASKLLPAKQAFRILDPDGNGYITEDNLVEVWEHFCKKAFVFVRMSWAWFLCKCAINVTEERVSKPSGSIFFFFFVFSQYKFVSVLFTATLFSPFLGKVSAFGPIRIYQYT